MVGAQTWCDGEVLALQDPRRACEGLWMSVQAVCLGRHLTLHSKGLQRRWRSGQRLVDHLISSLCQAADSLLAHIRWRIAS